MRVLIFDIGNVVIKADHGITHKKLIEYGVLEERAGTFFTNDGYKDFGRGKISGRDFYLDLIGKYLRHTLTYEQVVQAHDIHMYAVDSGVLNVLERLLETYNNPDRRLMFWTDTNEWQTRRERELVKISKYGQAIRSGDMRLLKRDAGSFHRVLAMLGAEPEEVTLVDDNPEICKLAKENGLKAHLFRNSKELGGFLKSEGHLK